MSEPETSPLQSETNPKPKRKRRPKHKHQQKPESEEEEEQKCLLSSDPQVCLAIYISMAHAFLALTLILLYGLSKLLQEYWRPIQWAILCSMPLREFQTALVRFWSHPLNLGLLETLLAIPIAVLRAATGSLIDSHVALLGLIRNGGCGGCQGAFRPDGKIGFSKLMQWVVSFGVFVLVYERIGAMSIPAFTVPCLIGYATGCGTPSTPGVARTLSAISFARRSRSVQKSSMWERISRFLIEVMVRRLKTTVGFGLITFMIVGSVLGFVMFSYKIGMEGKDAVMSLQTHLQESNYAERMGVNQWMDENQVPELVDNYKMKFYENLSEYIDSLALQYNVTEIVEGVQRYMVRPLQNLFAKKVPEQVRHRPFSEKLHCFKLRVRNREWDVVYRDFNYMFREFMSVIAWGDLVERIKGFVLHSLDAPKRVYASSSTVLMGSANMLFSMVGSLVSGAAGLLNFISQLMVFFWLLYYLITSESGGVMDHVFGMLPVSKSTRDRSAEVLDHAVSSVLLATAKVTIFQGCLTYLLFRFYRIHFLYMSTFLALMSAVLPITPSWLSSIPAVAQLAMEARYVEGVLLMVVHLVLMDYGTAAIQDEIPGHSAYLTGLSILGGMALFPSILEGSYTSSMREDESYDGLMRDTNGAWVTSFMVVILLQGIECGPRQTASLELLKIGVCTDYRV
ncbi:hypothetical protein GIB67_030854 [Kingdonia uniflora]|uniref:Transmembrane protein n=1 Tax=Kingdonia uniflora TaxID=39325 RepID=A0A7J7L376_9MAGN|nr:hypothetical protein GIB67_030854 [Kingdonia uniflora]